MKKIIVLLILVSLQTARAQQNHHVVKGDNLISIAKQYNVSVSSLLEANPVYNNRPLWIGDIIKIKGGKKNLPTLNTLATNAIQKSQFNSITIYKKQSLREISKICKISESDLRLLNPNVEDMLYPGYKLKMPHNNILSYEIAQQLEEEKYKNNIDQKDDSDIQYAKIMVTSKQIIRGIVKDYGISENYLRKLNPDLDKKMRMGLEVILPLENIYKYKKKD